MPKEKPVLVQVNSCSFVSKAGPSKSTAAAVQALAEASARHAAALSDMANMLKVPPNTNQIGLQITESGKLS